MEAVSDFVKMSLKQLQIPPPVSSDCFTWKTQHVFQSDLTRSDFISESLKAILKSFVSQIQVCTHWDFLKI